MKKHKKVAILICFLTLLAFLLPLLGKYIRTTEYYWTYKFFALGTYGLWFISCISGLVNGILIFQLEKIDMKSKIVWIIMSVLPIIVISLFIISVLTFLN